MIDQQFVDKIEELRRCTYSSICDIQKALCPMVKDINLDYRFDYWYEGYKYNLWEDDVHIYATGDIPYCYDNDLKNTTFIDTLDNLVKAGKVWPFLLFIEGKVTQWSKITVIHDYNYNYLKISGVKTDTSIDATIVVFPLHVHQIRYGEDNNILASSDRKGFYFGLDGVRLENPELSNIFVRLEILDPDIYYKEVNIFELTPKILQFTDLPDGYVATLDNILTFTSDGLYNYAGPSTNIEDAYNGSYGLFKTLQTSNNIKWAILMYNTKMANTESSYLYSKYKDLNKSSVVKLLTETSKEVSEDIWNNIITPLIQIFDFNHSSDKSYENNIAEATEYITKYDFALWKDVFIRNSKIKSITYTGTQFKALADNKDCVRLSRKYGNLIEAVALIFVNNKLYDYMSDVTYTTSTINIPLIDIQDNDHIEILLYTECNNNVLDIKVVDENTPIYIHPAYNLENCLIMSNEVPSDASYDVISRNDGRTQYAVNFTYRVDENYNYNITFEKPEYYNKILKIVPQRQFRYCRFNLKDEQHRLTLPTQFNYCHNPNQYLVFINGRKIDRTEYTITIMTEDRPFDRLILYVSTILESGDKVDIFYVPEPSVEKYKQSSMSTSGVLLLDDSESDPNYPTTYPLLKDTAMIFINGLKVNPLEIKNVSLNCLLIDVDKYERHSDGSIKKDESGNPIIKRSYVNSVDNITINEYMVGNEDISQYLGSTHSDSWKNLINTLLTKYAEETKSYAGLEKIFGNIFELENPESNYKDQFAGLRSVLYDIIIEHYLSNNATTGDKFVYDFERDSFDPKDIPDTTDVVKEILLVSPEQDKLLDYDVNSQNATPEDVLEGKLFDV